jgi:hypothetical protein
MKVITLSGLRMGVETAETPVATYPKLLNWGISAGAGALVGAIAVAMKSKKVTNVALGAGVGAALSSLLLVMMWPKETGA